MVSSENGVCWNYFTIIFSSKHRRERFRSQAGLGERAGDCCSCDNSIESRAFLTVVFRYSSTGDYCTNLKHPNPLWLDPFYNQSSMSRSAIFRTRSSIKNFENHRSNRARFAEIGPRVPYNQRMRGARAGLLGLRAISIFISWRAWRRGAVRNPNRKRSDSVLRRARSLVLAGLFPSPDRPPNAGRGRKTPRIAGDGMEERLLHLRFWVGAVHADRANGEVAT